MCIGTVLVLLVSLSSIHASPPSDSRVVDDYIKTLNAFEGSIGCKATLKGFTPGPALHVYVWLLDPNGAQIGQDEDFTYGINLQVEFAVQPTVSGLYTCNAAYSVNGQSIGNLQDQNQIYTIPTGETTLQTGWSGLIPTAYKWRGRLAGAGSFNGRQVRESEGGNDVDTCWWPGSAYAPASGLSGGTWDVNGSNEYGDDTVGWHWQVVDYYRANSRAPCQSETDQVMQINRPGSNWATYKTNRLKMGFTNTTVWSYRDGQQQSKNY